MRHAALQISLLVALATLSCVAPTRTDERVDAVAAYNTACAHARAGRPDDAQRWLQRAAERGFSGVHLATTDPDLDSIRGLEGYADAIATMNVTSAARLDAFRARAADPRATTILPPAYDPARPAPLIVALHGSGGTGAGLAAYWRAVAAETGAILVAPDAMRRAQAGFEWRYVDESEWLVLHTIERVAQRYAIDRERVLLTGFSQGANIALIVGTRHPERFCGLVPIAGHLEPHALDLPATSETRPRIALLIGGEDPSAKSYRRGLGALRGAGFETSLRVFPGVGHALPPRHAAALRRAWRETCG